ncbi:MAG TPA: hypothetical protein EYN06_08450 [Myxococcales bacterium]|nr:hypothetical protein [Myxococcales bacterium]HIN86496.1 hypothetical protein [Myxococcales bacterium]
MSNSAFVRLQVRINVIALLVALPIAWWVGGEAVTVATLAGGLLGMGNFVVGAWLIQRVILGPAAQSKALFGVMLAGKFGVLVLLAFVAIYILELDAVGFALGLSTMVVALFVAGFLFSSSPEVEETESEI